jgi:exodeoxyribonuclease VII small subunit
LTELEQIISEIEADDVDVDVLATKVKRAAELVKLCRARLRSAEEEVRKVMAEIEADSSEINGPAEEDEPEIE